MLTMNAEEVALSLSLYRLTWRQSLESEILNHDGLGVHNDNVLRLESVPSLEHGDRLSLGNQQLGRGVNQDPRIKSLYDERQKKYVCAVNR